MLQLVKAFEAMTDTKVSYELKPRREGDIVSMFANSTLAKEELGWTAKYSLENMCKSPTHHVPSCLSYRKEKKCGLLAFFSESCFGLKECCFQLQLDSSDSIGFKKKSLYFSFKDLLWCCLLSCLLLMNARNFQFFHCSLCCL